MNRRIIFVAAALFLAGCANDRYAVIPDGPGSEVRLRSDLRSCKDLVMAQYRHDQSHGGLVIGAVVGGAIGGVAGGLVDLAGGQSGNAMTLSDLNPAIESCMAQRGYAGTSEN